MALDAVIVCENCQYRAADLLTLPRSMRVRLDHRGAQRQRVRWCARLSAVYQDVRRAMSSSIVAIGMSVLDPVQGILMTMLRQRISDMEDRQLRLRSGSRQNTSGASWHSAFWGKEASIGMGIGCRFLWLLGNKHAKAPGRQIRDNQALSDKHSPVLFKFRCLRVALVGRRTFDDMLLWISTRLQSSARTYNVQGATTSCRKQWLQGYIRRRQQVDIEHC